jgi:hypothetical protein
MFTQGMQEPGEECSHGEWLRQFIHYLSVTTPELPADSLVALAAYWAPRAKTVSPEEAAQSASVWIQSGGIDA